MRKNDHQRRAKRTDAAPTGKLESQKTGLSERVHGDRVFVPAYTTTLRKGARKQFLNVFSDEISFEVDDLANFVEIVFENGLRVRDEHEGEVVVGDVIDGEGGAIDGDRAFFDDEVQYGFRRGDGDDEGISGRGDAFDSASRIDVPRDDMTAQSVTQSEGAFEVDAGA